MNRIISRLLLCVWTLIAAGCGVEDTFQSSATESTGYNIDNVGVALEATDNYHSAHRDPKRDWREYRDEYRRKSAASRQLSTLAAGTVEQNAVHPSSAVLTNIPVWSEANIKALFKTTRDERFMQGSSNPGFLRRPSWLFPEDGCFARAAVVASRAGNAGLARPYKLFSFGNLTVTTPNSPSGSVSWWYHVVPVIRSAATGEVYVYDPAIDPSMLLPWQDWLLKQVPSLNDVVVTIADSNAYVPNSPVSGGADPYSTALSDLQNWYLNQEWALQVQLGRDPTQVLGNSPPWAGAKELVYPIAGDLFVPACVSCNGTQLLTVRCLTHCP